MASATEGGGPLSDLSELEQPGVDAASHLIVIAHGMWGTPYDVGYMAKQLKAKLSHSIIHVSEVNTLVRTYHGIDVCGTRLVKDVKEFIAKCQDEEKKQITAISFVGYSAGGLFNRYACGLLWREGFFLRVRPVCFITIATPHLGCRELPHSSAQRLRNGFMATVSNFYCGRSGQQMMLADGQVGGPGPLLLEMSLPGSDFYAALAAFQHACLYANCNKDNTVNYITASLSEVNKYRGLTEPPTPPGSRWRFIVAESSVQVEPSTPRASQPHQSPTGVEKMQSPVAATKEVPVEGERRRTLEDVVMEEASTAVTSVYDQHFSPVLFPILAPLMVAHAVVVMTPLRLLSEVLGERSPDHYYTRQASSTASPRADGQPVEGSDDAKGQTKEALKQGRKKGDKGLSSPVVTGQGEASMSPNGRQNGSPPLAPAGLAGLDVSSVDVEVTPPADVDDVPALIRKYLRTLPLQRVDVFIPGHHTHGSIVVRRAWDKQGMEVIEHLIEKIDGHVQKVVTAAR